MDSILIFTSINPFEHYKGWIEIPHNVLCTIFIVNYIKAGFNSSPLGCPVPPSDTDFYKNNLQCDKTAEEFIWYLANDSRSWKCYCCCMFVFTVLHGRYYNTPLSLRRQENYERIPILSNNFSIKHQWITSFSFCGTSSHNRQLALHLV